MSLSEILIILFLETINTIIIGKRFSYIFSYSPHTKRYGGSYTVWIFKLYPHTKIYYFHNKTRQVFVVQPIIFFWCCVHLTHKQSSACARPQLITLFVPLSALYLNDFALVIATVGDPHCTYTLLFLFGLMRKYV